MCPSDASALANVDEAVEEPQQVESGDEEFDYCLALHAIDVGDGDDNSGFTEVKGRRTKQIERRRARVHGADEPLRCSSRVVGLAEGELEVKMKNENQDQIKRKGNSLALFSFSLSRIIHHVDIALAALSSILFVDGFYYLLCYK